MPLARLLFTISLAGYCVMPRYLPIKDMTAGLRLSLLIMPLLGK